jgi:hypothetical protein
MRPNLRRRVAPLDHLDLRVCKVEHEFRLRLKILRNPIGVVSHQGLGCVVHDVLRMRSLQHQCHPRRPRQVVGADKFVEVIASHGSRDERDVALLRDC